MEPTQIFVFLLTLYKKLFSCIGKAFLTVFAALGMILSQLFRFCRNSLFQFLNNGFPQKSFPQSHILSLVLVSFFFLNLAISLSMRLLQNGSCRGFGDFLILIFSETTVAAPLIIFLKSFISFKVILGIVLLTSSFSCFSRNASPDRTDGTGSFFGFSSNPFSHFVISLSVWISNTPFLSQLWTF